MDEQSIALRRELARLYREEVGPVTRELQASLHGPGTSVGDTVDNLLRDTAERTATTQFLKAFHAAFPYTFGMSRINLPVDKAPLLSALQRNMVWVEPSVPEAFYENPFGIKDYYVGLAKPWLLIGDQARKRGRHDVLLKSPWSHSLSLSVMPLNGRNWERLQQHREGVATDPRMQIGSNYVSRQYESSTQSIIVASDLPGAIRAFPSRFSALNASPIFHGSHGLSLVGHTTDYSGSKNAHGSVAEGLTYAQMEQFEVLPTLTSLATDFGISQTLEGLLKARSFHS